MNYLSNLLLIFSYFISRVVQWLKDYKKNYSKTPWSISNSPADERHFVRCILF